MTDEEGVMMVKTLSEAILVERIDQLSRKYFNKPYQDQAKYNYRLRTTGGRYIPSERLIEINPKYVLEMNDVEVVGIIKHELCHYHLHVEGKGYKHGDKEFKDLLKKTNSPRHCNPLPSERDVYRYEYKCQGCEHLYQRKRRVNLSRYRCGRCRGMLKLIK